MISTVTSFNGTARICILHEFELL